MCLLPILGWAGNLTSYPAAPAPNPHLIWIAPGPTRAGTGTVTGLGTCNDPYVGDVDIIVSNAPAYTAFYFLPGVFYIKADESYYLKTGQKLRGTGKDITIFRRDPSFRVGGHHTMFYSPNDGIEVSDMTLEGKFSLAAEKVGCYGVVMTGTGEVVRRVKIINLGGVVAAESECFPILLGPVASSAYGSGATGLGNLISECEVYQNKGNYGGGIGLTSGGVVEKCRVEFPPWNLASPFYVAYGAAGGANGAIFSHNVAIGGTWGWYTDTAWITNVIISENLFVGGHGGIRIDNASAGVVGLKILNNIIEVDPKTTQYPAGISLSAARGLFNVNISENLIRFQGDKAYPANAGFLAISLAPTNAHNLKVINNTVGTNMTVHTGTSRCVFSGNTDMRGNVIPLTP